MITYLQRKKFIEVYAKLDGRDIASACRLSSVSRASLYRLMAKDAQFKRKIDRIRNKRKPKDIHVSMTLIDKARMGHLPSINAFLNHFYGDPRRADHRYYCRNCRSEIDSKYIDYLNSLTKQRKR